MKYVCWGGGYKSHMHVHSRARAQTHTHTHVVHMREVNRGRKWREEGGSTWDKFWIERQYREYRTIRSMRAGVCPPT